MAHNPLSVLNVLIHTREERSEEEKALVRYLRTKIGSIESYGWGLNGVSLSPIRSRPKRTYDPTRVLHDPEGSNVPMLLMETKANQQERWDTLKLQLVEFGQLSGLFNDIDVKILGGSLGNPFQLEVKVRGPRVNIIDVGYGVSQILPILVHTLDSAHHRSRMRIYQPRMVLLQQPEVHLHPRAQAELSSLMTKLVGKDRHGRLFIIETHSDYMIDRARIEIRNGTIRAEDVSLIYLEPKRNVVNVHNISFDEMGNMEGVPPHYRDFFLKETDRLMGFEE